MEKSQNLPAVIVLQHPQEPEKEKSSTPLLIEELNRCGVRTAVRVGLSWPNIAKAVGSKAVGAKADGSSLDLPLSSLNPKDWVVLYLGSKRPELPTTTVVGLSRKGEPQVLVRDFKGIILLDGTWSQAKTLWWRNAWLLKCRRACVVTRKPSLYGWIRKEPREGCLSTLETTVELMRFFTLQPEWGQDILDKFKIFVSTLRHSQKRPTGKNPPRDPLQK